jgi:Sec-independent protein secretion pathway component TatC
MSLAVPLLLLFEGSIWSVRMVERRLERERAEKAAAAAGAGSESNPAE